MSGSLLATLVASFVVFALVMAGIGLGVMSGRRPLAGSCGGGRDGSCHCHPDQRPCEAWRKR